MTDTATSKPTLNRLQRPAIRKASPTKALDLLLKGYMAEVGQEDRHLRLILLGEYGSGKTCAIRTCRSPILIDSFDPSGTESALLTPDIESHRILRMTKFEKEQPDNPKVFQEYQSHFTRLKASGIFNKIGTYCIDSLTTLGDAVMYKVMVNTGLSALDVPEQRHYLKQQLYLINIVKNWTTLPCDVVATGHLLPEKDEKRGRIVYNMMITGKLTVKVPLLFQEIYIMHATRVQGGMEYKFQTSSDAHYKARTKMGAGKFDFYEKADVKALLRKAGREAEDLPPLEVAEKEGESKDGTDKD